MVPDAAFLVEKLLQNILNHFFVTLGDQRRRRDDIMTGRIALSRQVAGPVRLEVYWRGSRRVSNIALFDYDKQVVGVLVRVSTD